MSDAVHSPRSVPDRLDNPLRSAVFSWEALLVLVAIAIFIINSLASPYFLNAWSLSDLTFNFTEKEAMLTTTFYDAKPQSQNIEDHPLFMDTTAPLISSY